MPFKRWMKNLCVGTLMGVVCCSNVGCGVMYSYVHNEDRLEQPFSMLMTKTDVDAVLGDPGKVVKDNGRIQVWEYRLYSRYHWMKELVACPFTAWLGGCLLYPSIGVGDPNYPKAFYVVLYDDHLCLWGTLELISESTTCRDPLAASADERRDST